jgi:hypothetical protein
LVRSKTAHEETSAIILSYSIAFSVLFVIILP